MSFVADQVRRIDNQLDRLQLSSFTARSDSWEGRTFTAQEAHDPATASRISELQLLVKTLSATTYPRNPLIAIDRVRTLLNQAKISSTCTTCQGFDQESEDTSITPSSDPTYEHELEWLVVQKATAQVYGQVLNTILEQTIPLSNDIYYWDDILGSYRYSGLYSIQTSPLRLWRWSQEVYADARQRGGALAEDFTQVSLTERWKQFYWLVKEAVNERSLLDVQKRVVSPLARVRNEARKKQDALKKLRVMNANALGVLLGEGLSNECNNDEGTSSPHEISSLKEHKHKWRASVTKSISLIDAVLSNVNDAELSIGSFDNAIDSATTNDPYFKIQTGDTAMLRPAEVADRLKDLLSNRLPFYQTTFREATKKSGRPSRLIRYWFPAIALLLSSGTILRIVVNRKAEIITWIQEFGSTVIDFWTNWVVEPTKKVIGTIRHDEGSEVSIMSKKSLEGDRASLERMVVDFAKDNPNGTTMGEAELADLKLKVKEGDLTPVLKAYEKDLQKPFVGTIRGNLVRALLIQIQKTKVDVEVAMGGIDSLLKSQELVFGFVGLTPGILVMIGVSRWLSSMFGNRAGLKRGEKKGHMIKELRNIDRILAAATPTDFGELFYKDHGLLLCEVHVLRQSASRLFPRQVFRDFLEDIDDLVDIRTGVQRQMKVVDRIRWAYAKWL
ncbi:NCA2-domain-containing protein [Aulographum hederae CBS 113979]|uniref:NCA2-domain-containing protein n=1 Tax=Aulographum hederae CBS 113979 TaxID=1176131 RepID=A0A6G1H2D1_9PEZI|nr:NCA2-domain-containing protein [Aulographum hederae CBS 113979]